MSKKLILGALSVATGLSSFAVIGVAPTFADNDIKTSWHEVSVTAVEELILGGEASAVFELHPSVTENHVVPSGGFTVRGNEAWKVQWQAVDGHASGEQKVNTPGTGAINLGTSGFTTATTGYVYAGADTEATGLANKWGVRFTGSATITDNGITSALTNLATGSATSGQTIVPTYSASTDGSLQNVAYYGTIYYVLSPNE